MSKKEHTITRSIPKRRRGHLLCGRVQNSVRKKKDGRIKEEKPLAIIP